ncbi:MAG: response regulator [Leucobacter sp.]
MLIITASALLVRRRMPLTTLAVVALACAFSPLAQPGFGYPMIPFAFSLYTVASRQSTARSLLGYGIGIGATVLAAIPYSLSGTTPPMASILDPFSLIALVTGVIVKNRREQQQQLVERVNQRIENAALVERTRIAAEMHDIVAHSLTVIVSLANGAASIRARQPAKADAAIEQIAAVSRDALEDMHRTLNMLRSADSGLDENLHHSGDNLPTLDELAERFRAAGLPVTLIQNGDPPPEDAGVRQAIFRVVQESLTNTLRHAVAPTGASVTIHREAEQITITVEDDGEEQRTPPTPGHRLVGIGQRAAAHGGQAQSGPRPGGGWRNTVTLRTPEASADDHALVRAGNALVIEATDDLEVAGEASTGEEAVRLAFALSPDVVLMDVRMPGIGGIEATRRITEARPETRVIVLTTFDLDEYAFGSLKAGASAFLLKSATPGHLTEAIRTVAAGESVLDPRITRLLIETFVARDPAKTAGRRAAEPQVTDPLAADPQAALSPRELEVFTRIAAGMSNPEIGAQLHLTVPTIKSHVNRILAKLQARDRVHLVILAYEHGIVSAQ